MLFWILYMNSILLCRGTTFSSPVFQLIDMYVVHSSYLLWIICNKPGCACLFNTLISFLLGLYTPLGFLNQIAAMALVFWGTSILFSTKKRVSINSAHVFPTVSLARISYTFNTYSLARVRWCFTMALFCILITDENYLDLLSIILWKHSFKKIRHCAFICIPTKLWLLAQLVECHMRKYSVLSVGYFHSVDDFLS